MTGEGGRAPASADGYVTEIPYPQRYTRELNPHLLRFVLAGSGFRAPNLTEPFTYMELGFGRGLSLVMHAAANPEGQFFGVDILPEHVEAARKVTTGGSIGNVDVRCASFAELDPRDFPAFDIIVLHGVWSWISQSNRDRILSFIDRALKSSGFVYLSYNAMPAWVAALPLRHLMKAEFDRLTGTIESRVKGAVAYAQRLRDAKAQFFELNPSALARLKEIESKPAAYLAHEYFNADWRAFYFAEVAEDLGRLGFTYSGSADLPSNIDILQIPVSARPIHARARDTVERETIKDFVGLHPLRRDTFSRAPSVTARADFDRQIGQTMIVPLIAEAEFDSVSLNVPVGKVKLIDPLQRAVVAALAQGPQSISQLSTSLDHVAHREVGGESLLGTILMLAAACAVAIGRSASAAAAESCARLNQVLRESPIRGAGIVASPVIGGGVPSGPVDFPRINLESGRSSILADLT